MIRYCETKNFEGKSWNPPPLLSLTFFDTRNLLKHRRVPLRNDSVDKTILVENRNTRPLSYPERFSIPEINETLKNSPTKIFSTVRQKNFERNPWCSPPHLIHELIRYRKISETQHRRVPLRIFSIQWDNKFSIENRDFPLLKIFFSIPETFRNTEGFLYKKIRFCETKNFWQKIVALPPGLIPNIFR